MQIGDFESYGRLLDLTRRGTPDQFMTRMLAHPTNVLLA
jgi:hypothetical protein